MHNDSKGDTKFNLFDVLVIFICVWVSILYQHKYVYGLYDHSLIIPFIKYFINPSLYPNDYLINQAGYYQMGLLDTWAFFLKHSHIPIYVLFFFFYLISITFIFLSTYLIALTLFRKREVAVISLVILLFTPIPILGGVPAIDNLFLSRMAAYPVLLFSLYYFLNKKYVLAFLLQGIGLFINQLAVFHMILILLPATILNRKEIGLRRLFLYAFILFISGLPSLVQKFIYPMPSYNLLHCDSQWLALSRLRSPFHIFPFSWGMASILKEILFILLFLISWEYKPSEEHHRVIRSLTLSAFLLFLCGTIFTELLPVTFVVQSQFFRSSVFLAYVMVIYIANYLLMQSKLGRDTRHRCAIIVTLILLFSFGQYVVSCMFEGKKNNVGLVITNAQDKSWLNVQGWAKSKTDFRDTFIVPPGPEGFRVESERTIYGEWKDGLIMFFNPEWGKEWFKRMQALGYQFGKPIDDGFYQLREKDFIKIARQEILANHKVFLVAYINQRPLNFPIAYRNNKFIVYQVNWYN